MMMMMMVMATYLRTEAIREYRRTSSEPKTLPLSPVSTKLKKREQDKDRFPSASGGEGGGGKETIVRDPKHLPELHSPQTRAREKERESERETERERERERVCEREERERARQLASLADS